MKALSAGCEDGGSAYTAQLNQMTGETISRAINTAGATKTRRVVVMTLRLGAGTTRMESVAVEEAARVVRGAEPM